MSTSRPSTRVLRPSPWLLLTVLSAVVLAACASSPGSADAASSGTATGPVAAAAAPAPYYPKEDYPELPPRCGGFTDGMPNEAGQCNVNGFRKGRPTIVLWGDSHAFQWEPAMENAAKNKVNLVAFFSGSCPPMLSPVPNPSAGCNRSNWLATNFVQRLDRQGAKLRVVLGGSWQRYRAWIKGLPTYKYPCISNKYARSLAGQFKSEGPALFKLLGRNRIRTDVIGQSPVVPIEPGFTPAAGKRCAPPTNGSPYPRSKALLREDGTKQWLWGLMRPLQRPRLINVADRLCSSTKCTGYDGTTYTFFNWLHVSRTKSMQTSAAFQATVDSLL